MKAIIITGARYNKQPIFSWQLRSYIVYLFPFAWWQHRFDTTLNNTHKHTDRQMLTGYTISSAS